MTGRQPDPRIINAKVPEMRNHSGQIIHLLRVQGGQLLHYGGLEPRLYARQQLAMTSCLIDVWTWRPPSCTLPTIFLLVDPRAVLHVHG